MHPAVAACLLLLVAWPSAGREPPELARASDEVRAAVARLARATAHEGGALGEGGAPSPVHAAYVRLRDRAEPALLRLLTRASSPVVRVYAVQALVEREETVADALRLVTDGTRLPFASGCEEWDDAVGDVVIDLVWERLSPRQRVAIADELARRGVVSRHRPRLLVEAARAGLREAELRAMAGQDAEGALAALAVFRRDHDRALILARLGREETRVEALRALAEWPLPEAFAAVRDAAGAHVGAAVVALAAYGRPDPVLEAAPGAVGWQDELVDVLARTPCPAYEALLLRLLRDGRTSGAALDRLVAGDRAALRAALGAALARGAPWGLRDGALRRALELVADDADGALRARLVLGALEVRDPDAFPLAAWLAARDRLKEAVPLLAAPVERLDRPSLVLAAVRGLLAYRREVVDARLDRAIAGHAQAGRRCPPALRALLLERPRTFDRPPRTPGW